MLVCTTFRDFYVTLAVLNTIVSTGLSCYSRYMATVSQGGFPHGDGNLACSSVDCGKGQQKRHSGAWHSVPHRLPVAEWDQFHGHT